MPYEGEILCRDVLRAAWSAGSVVEAVTVCRRLVNEQIPSELWNSFTVDAEEVRLEEHLVRDWVIDAARKLPRDAAVGNVALNISGCKEFLIEMLYSVSEPFANITGEEPIEWLRASSSTRFTSSWLRRMYELFRGEKRIRVDADESDARYNFLRAYGVATLKLGLLGVPLEVWIGHACLRELHLMLGDCIRIATVRADGVALAIRDNG